MTDQTKLSVLIVDDDAGSRLLLSEVFWGGDHSVTEADSGEGALAALREEDSSFDLMVLDIQMPGMDGLEVADRVRHMARYRELPILAVTALAHPSDAARVLRAGCDAYLAKPVSVDDVRAVAGQLLVGGRDRAALHAFVDALEHNRQQAAGDPRQ